MHLVKQNNAGKWEISLRKMSFIICLHESTVTLLLFTFYMVCFLSLTAGKRSGLINTLFKERSTQLGKKLFLFDLEKAFYQPLVAVANTLEIVKISIPEKFGGRW